MSLFRPPLKRITRWGGHAVGVAAPAAVSLPTALKEFAFNGTLVDAQGGTALTGSSVGYVTGVNGQAAQPPAAMYVAGTLPAAVTIMAWVRVNSDATEDIPLFGYWDTQGAAGSSHFALYNRRTAGPTPTTNSLGISIRLGGSLSIYDTGNGTRASVGTWAHVAATYDGAAVKVYLDGVLVVNQAATGLLDTGSLNLAAENKADIDDLRVYNTALSEAQVGLAKNTPVLNTITPNAYETVWDTAGSSTGTGAYKDLVFPGVQVGDLIIAYAASEEHATAVEVRSIATQFSSVAQVSGGWNNILPTTTQNSDADFVGGWGIVTTAGDLTIRGILRNGANKQMGVAAIRIPAAYVNSTRGFVTSFAADADGVVSATIPANSIVFHLGADWTAATMTTSTTPVGGTAIKNNVYTGAYSIWNGMWQNQAAGTRSYGPSGLTGRDMTGAVFAMTM